MKIIKTKTRGINTQMHGRLIRLLPVVSMMIGAPALAGDKTLIDYFLPMPITDSLSKDVWGAAEVGPRGPQNGLEDTTMKQWSYWDGQIIVRLHGLHGFFGMVILTILQLRRSCKWTLY